jgi:type II secretory pathway component PulF
MTTAPRLPSTSLDDLIALNEELLALVRGGVPLEQGLVQAAVELRGTSRRLALALAEQLQQGRSIVEVLAENPQSFPPVYRAAVEAGIRSGRLASAMEAIARSARRLAESRRTAAVSLTYPMVVLLAAMGFIVFFLYAFAPSIVRVLDDFRSPVAGLFRAAVAMGPWTIYLGAGLMGIVAILWGTWWLAIRRASLLDDRNAHALLGCFPWVGSVLRGLRAATFGEILATLIEQGVPQAESLVLAAEAAGGLRLAGAVRPVAESLKRGLPVTAMTERGLTAPLMRWLVLSERPNPNLAAALRKLADFYAAKAAYEAERVRMFLPMLLTCVIGGGATLLYGLMVFGTWRSILETLGR